VLSLGSPLGLISVLSLRFLKENTFLVVSWEGGVLGAFLTVSWGGAFLIVSWGGAFLTEFWVGVFLAASGGVFPAASLAAKAAFLALSLVALAAQCTLVIAL